MGDMADQNGRAMNLLERAGDLQLAFPSTTELLDTLRSRDPLATRRIEHALPRDCGVRNRAALDGSECARRLVLEAHGLTDAPAPEREATPAPEPAAVRADPLTFERMHYLGYAFLSIAPRGSPVTAGSSLKPDTLGKTPSQHAPDGRVYSGNWPSWSHTAEDARLYDGWREKYGDVIGVRGGEVVAFDVDVSDAELAHAIHQSIQTSAGDTVTRRRTGGSPKFLMMFKTATTMRKRRVAWEGGALELLGTGQYWNLDGPHPAGDRYELDGPLPPAAELPVLTTEQVEAIFADVVALLAARGITPTQLKGSATDRSNVDQTTLRAPSIEVLAELVGRMDNDTTYDEWVADLAAITVVAPLREEWREKLDSIRPPFAVGWTYLLERARQQDINTAGYEFEVVTDTPPVESEQEPAQNIEPLLTEGERIAAITGLPARALFAEAASLNGNFAVRRIELDRAAAHGDPLGPTFQRHVLLPASRFSGREADQFTALLDAQLASTPEVQKRTPEERRLLKRAAFVALAPYPTLLAGTGEAVPVMEQHAGIEPEWLVEGLISQGVLAGLVGAPGAGKSFVALDLAAQVARGGHFMSHAVTEGEALYFVSEDSYGLRRRLLAAYPGGLSRLHLIPRPLPLSQPEQALRLVGAAIKETGARAVKLIVVDLFRDSLVGDENTAEVMGAAMATAHLLTRQTGATILFVHHAPRSDPSRPRGSSAFDGALDWWASVEGHDGNVRLTVQKNRVGPRGNTAVWHIVEGGILRPGPKAATGGGVTLEDLALAAAHAVHGGATPGVPLTRSQISALVAEEHPAVFGPDVSRGSVSSRLSRGLKEAVRRGWIRAERKQFVPGDAPPLAPGSMDLEAVTVAGGVQ